MKKYPLMRILKRKYRHAYNIYACICISDSELLITHGLEKSWAQEYLTSKESFSDFCRKGHSGETDEWISTFCLLFPFPLIDFLQPQGKNAN